MVALLLWIDAYAVDVRTAINQTSPILIFNDDALDASPSPNVEFDSEDIVSGTIWTLERTARRRRWSRSSSSHETKASPSPDMTTEPGADEPLCSSCTGYDSGLLLVSSWKSIFDPLLSSWVPVGFLDCFVRDKLCVTAAGFKCYADVNRTSCYSRSERMHDPSDHRQYENTMLKDLDAAVVDASTW